MSRIKRSGREEVKPQMVAREGEISLAWSLAILAIIALAPITVALRLSGQLLALTRAAWARDWNEAESDTP